MSNAERDELIMQHLGLPQEVAGFFIYKHPWASHYQEDLESEALVGMMDAAEGWDPSVGPFKPYARAIMWRRVVGHSHHLTDTFETYDGAKRSGYYTPVVLSLDDEESGDWLQIEQPSADPDPDPEPDVYLLGQIRGVLGEHADGTPTRSLDAVVKYYGLDGPQLTSKEIAAEWGVKRATVLSALKRARAKLREHLVP